MAKELTLVNLVLTSANSDLDLDSLRVEYRIADGDLSKASSMVVSGVDALDSVSGMWDEVISSINGLEGLS